MLSLAGYPFYEARVGADGRPAPWTLDDLEDFASAGDDPFAGRLRAGDVPRVALQIEATSEPPVWAALGPGEPDAWAAGLARMWARWGMAPGETIAFFEYGSSPLVLFSSASYVAYLSRGAADRLGVSAVCNDGVASMASRMVSIVATVSPSAMILRRDVLAPFADALRAAGTRLEGLVRWAAVTEPEGAPAKTETARFAAEWRIPVHRILRADAAFLTAGDCPECGLFHLDGRLYGAEETGGRIAVSARFARLCPAARYDLGCGEFRPGGCPREPRARRIAVE